MKTAILFLCHFYNDSMLSAYTKLQSQSNHDVFWAWDTNVKNKNIKPNKSINYFDFDGLDINKLLVSPLCGTSDYKQAPVIWGREYLIPYYFICKYPEYDYVWVIEYDCRYTDNWSELFDEFNNNSTDFLSTHICNKNIINKEWGFWPRITTPDNWELVKSFNVICRYSKKLLYSIKAFLNNGYDGFYEVVPATVAYNNNLTIEEISGYGKFTPEERENKFYINKPGVNEGDIRWLPIYTEDKLKELVGEHKLIHPVKDEHRGTVPIGYFKLKK